MDPNDCPAIQIGVPPEVDQNSLTIPEELQAVNIMFTTMGWPTHGGRLGALKVPTECDLIDEWKDVKVQILRLGGCRILLAATKLEHCHWNQGSLVQIFPIGAKRWPAVKKEENCGSTPSSGNFHPRHIMHKTSVFWIFAMNMVCWFGRRSLAGKTRRRNRSDGVRTCLIGNWAGSVTSLGGVGYS